MEKINKITSILLVAILFLIASCKKVENGINDQIVSFNESTVTSIQIDNKLKVGFIANNVTNFEFSILKDSEVLLTDEVTLVDGQRIVEEIFDIPLNEDWIGEAFLRVSYMSDGMKVEKVRSIIFQESNPTMYIVGGSTGAGWEPQLATPLSLYDSESKSKFQTYEYLDSEGGGFKFLPTNVDWTNAYGLGNVPFSLLQDKDADNLPVIKSGFYRIRMDGKTLTYELLDVVMGVIGDATKGGWDKDTPMSFVGSKGSYLWRVKTELVPGNLKFRGNSSWSINFGGTLSNIVEEGSDIPISSAGIYLIELNLKPGEYTAVIEKQ